MDLIELDRIFDEVIVERQRQERLKASGKFEYTCADATPTNYFKASVLGEEYGEACAAVNEKDDAQLREELIQVAAVAVAWVQALDRLVRK